MKTNTLAPELRHTIDAYGRAANCLAVGPIDFSAIPLSVGALYIWGVLLSPALGAGLMGASTVVVTINARLLKLI